MTNLQAIILGIVQGLTEFLPVSSSGHLVLLENIMRVRTEQPLIFEIVLHLGTLLAILLVYRHDIVDILRFAIYDGWRREAGQPLWRKWRTREEGWIIPCVIVGSVPTALIGLLFQNLFERLFTNPAAVGIALLVTGALLMLSRFGAAKTDRMTDMSLLTALIIGTVQGLAITPGISRSGSTIAVALLLGIGRETAGKYSFLLSIPAIIGALGLRLAQDFHIDPRLTFDDLFLGFMLSFIAGYIALRLLLAFIRRGQLSWWSWYCWLIGAVAIVWFGFWS